MKILLSNDDGIQAQGMNALAKELCKEHDVYIVAPDQERSAAGHALTLNLPLRVIKTKLEYDVKEAWAVSGTPGDCVKIAINAVLGVKPDLIISGINHGPNLGSDVLYSGTVSAAIEGAVLGFPSLAVSLADLDGSSYCFKYAAQFISKFIPNVMDINFPKQTILNINIPDAKLKEINGIEITKLGNRMYTDEYELRVDPRGKNYYWMAGEVTKLEQEKNTDISAIRRNCVSITPVNFDMTHETIIPSLREAFCKHTWYKD